jgi:hypothetical protein
LPDKPLIIKGVYPQESSRPPGFSHLGKRSTIRFISPEITIDRD